MHTLLEQMSRQALRHDERRLQSRYDASTFRLQQQFMRAHGAARGQLTTLVTTSVEGGVFVSTQRR